MQHYIATPAPARRRWLPLLAVLIMAFTLSGCATAVIGSVTVSQISTMAGLASTATTGKGLQDHALSIVTGQDCRIVEGIFRQNRRICEEPGSEATQDDFRGVVVLLLGDGEDDAPGTGEAPEVLYAGAAHNDNPALMRSQRRGPAEIIELPYDVASFPEDLPLMRPGTYLANRRATVIHTASGPALSRTVFPQPAPAFVAVAPPAEDHEPFIMERAGDVPSANEWASIQPRPRIATASFASE